jgi:branched-chain amino acid transport system permease protein
MRVLEAALIGLATGSIYALSASGVVLTYTATGVFNLAHFAIALLAGYLGWQLNGVWGVPLVVAVPIVLVVCGPVLGLLLERIVFRPLQARRASSSELLVASLGVTVLVLAIIDLVWGPGVQGTSDEPVPRLFPLESFEIGDLRFDTEQIGRLAVVLVVSALLYVLLRRTFLGTKIRAVVDRRELAELAGIDSHQVSRVAWSLGCTLAALTGLLLAPPALEPFRIIFTGIETFSVAVIARLVSLPVAVAAGILIMGAGQGMLDLFEPFGGSGAAAETYQGLVTNLSVVVLFFALVLMRRLDEVGDRRTTGPGLVTASFGRVRRGVATRWVATSVLLAAGLFAPAVLDRADLRLAQQTLALALIFVSIVAITGFSGHLTLGQASIAGLGAYFTARAANAWDLPVLLAMACGAGVALLAGLVAGWPALKRTGLFLGLTTLGLGLLIDRFVFNTDLLAGGPEGLIVERPHLGPWSLQGDVGFYFFELALLTIGLWLAHNLRSGRLGRVLGAMRDSEVAARAIGIDLRRAKLFVFAASSAMAGVGGALLAQTDQTWDVATFNPLFSLFWFTAVVVCGLSSTGGALLAAVLFVVVPRVTGQDVQSAVGLFGLLALFLGRLPGGVIGNLGRVRAAILTALSRAWADARRVEAEAAAEPAPAPAPSAFARRVLEERKA